MGTQGKQTIDEATLHLMSSVRAKAEEVSAEEGVTLNEFVNVAVAEKLAHYAHLEWLKRRKVPSEESVMEARRILHRDGSPPPEAGDELPAGYHRPMASS
jgi:hypothetical protein